jgi:hypothetical protein
MLLLNFAHPFTQAQLEQITKALNATDALRVVDIRAQFDPQQPFAPKAVALADAAGLTPAQWQTEPLLVNLPSLNHIAACLLAELHGRMGYFPSIIRLRPIAGSTPPQFEFAEIIDLQRVRNTSRQKRS